MAVLMTADAATFDKQQTRIDLHNVGRVHVSQFVVYVELDDVDLEEARAGGLTLEAESFFYSPKRLLLRDLKTIGGDSSEERLIWIIRNVPPGTWLLSLLIGGEHFAARLVSLTG